MCGGGDDDDGGDTQSNYEKEAYGDGGRTAKNDAAANKGPAPDVSTASDRDSYVSGTLASQGYNDNYKGVVSGNGSSVLDGFGNPVLSGSYARTKAGAESEYDAYQGYTAARDKAEAEFYADMNQRPQVNQSLIDMALSEGGYIGDFYDDEGNVREDYDPTQEVNSMIGPPSAQNLSDYGNYLGSSADEFSFPGFNFGDPYGSAMAPQLSQIDGSALGSSITTQNERDYFNNFSDGFNDENSSFFGLRGNKFESDAAGNIGVSTGGQRFGDAAGNMLMGVVGGAFGPIGSALAAGTNVNTMNAYGEMIPGYNSQIQTTSFGPGNALGGLIGSQLGSSAGEAVGQKIYNSTGNINGAIAGAVGTGVGMNMAGSKLGGLADSAYGLGYVGSNTSLPYQQQLDQGMEDRGFGESVGGNDGGGNEAPVGQLQSQLTPGSSPTMNVGQSVGDAEMQTVVSGDVGSGTLTANGSENEFDPLQFFLTQAKNANPNSVQPTDLFGDPTADISNNPLFSAAPAGVQYLSQGRQRQFGTGTYNVQNAMQQKKSNRRGGIGDRLIGVVV
tara:strand:- start:23221 stop:24894 length:1674 start_codon:yes stop_codon:yes gene_type:complete